MISMPIIEDKATNSVDMYACGLVYSWREGYLSIHADGILICRQQMDIATAVQSMSIARDAHHNFLESSP